MRKCALILVYLSFYFQNHIYASPWIPHSIEIHYFKELNPFSKATFLNNHELNYKRLQSIIDNITPFTHAKLENYKKIQNSDDVWLKFYYKTHDKKRYKKLALLNQLIEFYDAIHIRNAYSIICEIPISHINSFTVKYYMTDMTSLSNYLADNMHCEIYNKTIAYQTLNNIISIIFPKLIIKKYEKYEVIGDQYKQIEVNNIVGFGVGIEYGYNHKMYDLDCCVCHSFYVDYVDKITITTLNQICWNLNTDLQIIYTNIIYLDGVDLENQHMSVSHEIIVVNKLTENCNIIFGIQKNIDDFFEHTYLKLGIKVQQ